MTLGVALISFNRSDYFSKLIKSLEKQVDCGVLDFHLFQDGAVNKFSHVLKTDPNRCQKCVDVFDDSSLLNKTKHIHKLNVGNAINQFEAIEFMSDHYDYFLVIEDDVILSKFYFRLIRLLIEQYLDRSDVFSVALNFKRMCRKTEVLDNLDKVGYDLHDVGSISLHWWAECFSSKKWKMVRPHFLKYYKLVENIDYQKRPRPEIQALFASGGLNIAQTSQDAGKDFAVKQAGLKRVNSVVNRGFYIGERGMHFNRRLYLAKGYQNQKPFEFASDSKLEVFKTIN